MEHRSVNIVVVLPALLVVGCDNMADQPRQETFEASVFYDNGASARPLVEGVVPRGVGDDDPTLLIGTTANGYVTQLPIPVTMALLMRGRERFEIYCSPCHGRIGDGQGMISQRGFPMPPTFHSDRLRSAPVGHMFDVITVGYGKMPPYARQVPPRDRWAIIAYVRALQRSQYASLDDVPPQERPTLEGQAP